MFVALHETLYMWACELPVVRWDMFVFLKQLLQGDKPVKKGL